MIIVNLSLLFGKLIDKRKIEFKYKFHRVLVEEEIFLDLYVLTDLQTESNGHNFVYYTYCKYPRNMTCLYGSKFQPLIRAFSDANFIFLQEIHRLFNLT